MSTDQTPPARLAVQLYTLREQAAVDMPAVLRRVAAAGYAGVELAGFGDLSPQQLAAVLDDLGLDLASAHVGFWDADAFARELDALAGIGCDTAVVPMLLPDRFADRATVADAAETLSTATRLATERGMALGYHNHYWEFTDVDGRPALLWLFDDVDPATFAEVDIYWAQVGGADPAELVASLGTRARLLHVKDGPADGAEHAMVAVGRGNVDVPGVLAAAPHARWHIVELDRCDTDMFEAVEASARFLLDGGLTRGRA